MAKQQKRYWVNMTMEIYVDEQVTDICERLA